MNRTILWKCTVTVAHVDSRPVFSFFQAEELPGYKASMHAVILQCLFCHALASQLLPWIWNVRDVNFCVLIFHGLVRILKKNFYMVLSLHFQV